MKISEKAMELVLCVRGRDRVKKATEQVLCVLGGDRVRKATECWLFSAETKCPTKESYRVLVDLGGDRVLLLLKLLRSFGQGQVDCKDNEVYCEFMSMETRVYVVG